MVQVLAELIAYIGTTLQYIRNNNINLGGFLIV